MEEDSLNINEVVSRNGALYCFCEEHIKQEGDKLGKFYEFKYSDP